MSLFDWLSSLWGSNGSEVNQESENVLANDGAERLKTAAADHDEILNQTHHLNVQTQDTIETDLEAMEFEDAVSDE